VSVDPVHPDGIAQAVASDAATEIDLLNRGRYVDALAGVAAAAETPLVIAV
jgi:hypothetical protein